MIQAFDGNYRVCDALLIREGRAELVWPGLWRKGARDKMSGFAQRYLELAPLIQEHLQTIDVFFLDVIYVQAKRWENTVGRPEVQKFAGALQGQRAKKGIMITTSSCSGDAQDCASRIDSKIVLIGGEQLAQLMIDPNLGVSPMATYEVKKIDTDYFTEQ